MSAQVRRERLALALRANLKRRKAHASGPPVAAKNGGEAAPAPAVGSGGQQKSPPPKDPVR